MGSRLKSAKHSRRPAGPTLREHMKLSEALSIVVALLFGTAALVCDGAVLGWLQDATNDTSTMWWGKIVLFVAILVVGFLPFLGISVRERRKHSKDLTLRWGRRWPGLPPQVLCEC